MRVLIFLVCLFPVLILATPPEYASGKPSLDILLNSGIPENQQIVGMTGFYGQDQPRQWLILAKHEDSGEMTEYVVADKKVVGKRKLRHLPNQVVPSITIDRDRLKIDSNIAFDIAEFQARQESVTYDSVHYQLRCRDQKSEPVWVVNMLDPVGKSIGIHYVSAESGVLLRSVWHRPNRELLSKAEKDSDGAPVSLLYGAKVTEITVSGNAGSLPRKVKRSVQSAQ